MKLINRVMSLVRMVTGTLIVVAMAAVVPVAITSPPAMAETGPPNCMAPPATPEQGRPVIEVLTGTTSTDLSSTLAARRSAIMSKVAVAGFRMQARLLVDTIGGGVTDSNLSVNTQLQPSGPNQLFVQQSQQCKQRGVSVAFAHLQRTQAVGSVDVLGALQVAQSNLNGLAGTKTPVDLVLMSSMMDVSGPLNLDGGPGLAQDPKILIAQVRSDHLLPDCRGWHVYIVGAGTQATGSLNDSGYEELKAFWTDFFAACGGQVVYYDNQLAQFPVKAAHRPSVHVKPVVHLQQVVMTLPDDVLFASGSPDLSPEAGTVLTQLLPVLQQRYPHGSIQVTGYTDNLPINIPGGNTRLSIERAQAVITWLSQQGVAAGRMQALGLGPADPVASNATPAGQAQNRRVVVAVAK